MSHLVFLPHMIDVENICKSYSEEEGNCLTVMSWMYRFLDGVPEIHDCEHRLMESLRFACNTEDMDASYEDLSTMLTPEQLHKIWHEAVLGLDACTRLPIQYIRVEGSFNQPSETKDANRNKNSPETKPTGYAGASD